MKLAKTSHDPLLLQYNKIPDTEECVSIYHVLK
jgi:hypothetical protein